MAEKFTNIAGGAFQPYVAKQIENRKKFLQESHIKRENKHLLYQNNRNSWVRLTSCVDVLPIHPLSTKYNTTGNELSKKYILQGGVVSQEGNQIINRSGFEANGAYNLLPDKPMGLKPMPGIISIDLSSAGKLGTLQYATIRFMCYDLEQLELMDALYMKLGFSLVLEWGHTIFIDDELSIKNPTPMDVFSFNNKESLIKEIQKKRLYHQGNYDALLGTVSNFGWEIQSDGLYLCEIKLVGAGDVLESLKINQSINEKTNFVSKNSINPDIQDEIDDNEEDLSSQIADKDLSLLNNALFSIYQQVLKYSPNKNSGIRVVATNTKGYRNILNRIYTNCPYNFIKFEENGTVVGDEIALKGNHYSLLSGINKNNGGSEVIIPNNSQNLFTTVSVPFKISGMGGDSEKRDQVYITLGHLLALITATGMLYNTTEKTNGKPHIYIDFNDRLNYCATFKGQLSMNPEICVIPRNQSNIDDAFGLGLVEDTLFNSINGTKLTKESSSSTIIGGSSTGGVPVSYTTTESKIVGEEKSSTFINNYLNLPDKENEIRARMMYILININFITDTLKKLRDNNNKGNVNLSDFLNEILSGISKSLCGFNEFRISIDDSNKCLRIIDDNKLLSQKELEDDKQYTEIPLLGKESIVYNYSFKSKIGPNMASMVTIAAQANPSALGDDSFAISNLSRGLIDRVNTEKTPSNTSPLPSKISESNLQTLQTHIKNILGNGRNVFILNTTSVDPSINTYKDILSNYRINEDSVSKASIIIPLDFNLEMDGISGIIPNSAFTVPINLLPSSYKTKTNQSKIAFIIHTINQSFNNNKWTTKITGQTINIRFDKEDVMVYKPQPIQGFTELLSSLNDVRLNVPSSVIKTEQALTELKNIIGFYESGNSYTVSNTGMSGRLSVVNITGITFRELKSAQDLTDENNRSRVFAAGRFQIIPSTMEIIKRGLSLKGTDRYDAKTQEIMADWLLLDYSTRRAIGNYIKGNNQGTIKDLENAINNIGYEWASMPVVKKSNGQVVGDVQIGTGNIANYGGSGANPTHAKTSIKNIAINLINARINYCGKSPIFIPNYYAPYK